MCVWVSVWVSVLVSNHANFKLERCGNTCRNSTSEIDGNNNFIVNGS